MIEIIESKNLLEESRRETSEKKWLGIISEGENDSVEFKSSLRWDYKSNEINTELEYVIAKTISAFLNSKGGTLFIGVDDSGKILGIEKDYKTLGKKQNKDGFLLKLTNLINNYLGKEFHYYLSIRIENIGGKDACIIKISNSKVPCYVKFKGKEEFFIRASASTQPMSIREANEYITAHIGFIRDK